MTTFDELQLPFDEAQPGIQGELDELEFCDGERLQLLAIKVLHGL